MQDSSEAMLVALGAVCIGLIFDQLGSTSLYFSLVGRMFIMGAFIIAATSFLLFMKKQITGTSDDELMWRGQH